MTEKNETEKRGRGDRPSMSPGLESADVLLTSAFVERGESNAIDTTNVRSSNPRQSGDRRYERSLEAADEEDGAHNQPKEKAANASSVRAKNYVAYTIKLPSDQLSALQSIWLELKKLYGSHSPDKSGMIQAAIDAWLKRWDGPEHDKLLEELLDIRQSTRRRQYRKGNKD